MAAETRRHGGRGWAALRADVDRVAAEKHKPGNSCGLRFWPSLDPCSRPWAGAHPRHLRASVSPCLRVYPFPP